MELMKIISNYKLSTCMYMIVVHYNSGLVLNNSRKDELENLKS